VQGLSTGIQGCFILNLEVNFLLSKIDQKVIFATKMNKKDVSDCDYTIFDSDMYARLPRENRYPVKSDLI